MNRQERKDFTKDRNDLKGWMAGESIRVWGDIAVIRMASGAARRDNRWRVNNSGIF
jgi:hypothetical protein